MHVAKAIYAKLRKGSTRATTTPRQTYLSIDQLSTIMSTGEKQGTQDRLGTALYEHKMCASVLCRSYITYMDGNGQWKEME